MDSPFTATNRVAEHEPPKPRVVFHDEDPEILDEDPEVLACWIAGEQIKDVEARIVELGWITSQTRTEELRRAIYGAIQDCERRRSELVAFLSESVSRVPTGVGPGHPA